MTLLLVVAIPFATVIGIVLFGGRLGRRTLGALSAAGLALSFGAAASMIASLRDRPNLEATLGPWLPITGADLALVVDSSMLAVTLAITGVSALIALYSIADRAQDRGNQRYFAEFVLLVGGMLVVVLASNLLLLVAGLQLAGICAYLLVDHRSTDAPTRVLLIARIGDAAILAGALVLFTEFHTVDIAQLGGAALEHGSTAGSSPVIASILLLIGAMARSAQAPLHVWLPDSTDAPTSVSALVQTVLVTGGVVLLMRLRSILVPDVLQAAAIVGGITALGGALVAIAQRDVRRVLAWSTISQVGLMFVAAGLGALFAARFQLIAHALFKAVLVLSAGSARRRWTVGAFVVGTLSLAGLPPAAGFFGIAAIASAAFSASDVVLTAGVLAAAGAIAFAAVRLFALMRVAPETARHNESRPLQTIVLAILAVGALVFGAIVSVGTLPIGSGPADTAPLWLLVSTFAVAGTGSLAAGLIYRRGIAGASRTERGMRWARSGLGFDALYARGIAGPFAGVGRELERGAERSLADGIDGIGALMGRASRAIGRGSVDGRAEQLLLVTGIVVLLAFWTWSGQ